MMKTIHTLIFFTGMLLCMACGEEDYPLYDTTQQDAVFIEYKNATIHKNLFRFPLIY